MRFPLRVVIKSCIAGLEEACRVALTKNPRLQILVENSQLVISDVMDSTTTVLLCEPSTGASLIDQPEYSKIVWMQSTYAGVNALLGNSTRRDYLCTRIGSGFGPQMAEYCMGWILHHYLCCDKSIQDQLACQWDSTPYISRKRGLQGKVLGILGAGNIGTSIAITASAFGMNPIGFVRNSSRTIATSHVLSSWTTTSLEEVLRSSDVLINCLPSTPQSRNMLTLEKFDICKENMPIFINVGRGDIAAEETILEALDRGYLSRAVLDVFPIEPIPSTSRLWTHPKINITPHISALSTPDIVATVFISNLEKFIDSHTLEYVVDMTAGY